MLFLLKIEVSSFHTNHQSIGEIVRITNYCYVNVVIYPDPHNIRIIQWLVNKTNL